jgi:hypothetical protein
LEEDFLERLPVLVRHEICNVFKDEVSRSKLPSQSDDLIEESASFSTEPSLLPGTGQILAGEAGGDDINSSSCTPKGADVVVERDMRPVVVKDALGVGLDLAEAGGAEPAY